jgi:hypothetical protein
MSDGELSRLEVLRDLDQRRLIATAAAQLLGIERRQVFRLLRAYRAEGPAGLGAGVAVGGAHGIADKAVTRSHRLYAVEHSRANTLTACQVSANLPA